MSKHLIHTFPARRLLPAAMLLAAATGLSAAEAQSPADSEVILDAGARPDGGTYTDAEILPVPGGGTVFALRVGTEEARYSFSLKAVTLTDLLGTLSQTLYDEQDTAAVFTHGERLTVWDDNAHTRTIDITVQEVSLATALDLASVESNCNIFVENRTIIVDRCD